MDTAEKTRRKPTRAETRYLNQALDGAGQYADKIARLYPSVRRDLRDRMALAGFIGPGDVVTVDGARAVGRELPKPRRRAAHAATRRHVETAPVAEAPATGRAPVGDFPADLDPTAERARCRHDGRPIARVVRAGRDAKWRHVDGDNALACTATSGRTVAEPDVIEAAAIEEPAIDRAPLMSVPRFPAGTPEYAAYAAELRTELHKFANGAAPYVYPPRGPARTVPNPPSTRDYGSNDGDVDPRRSVHATMDGRTPDCGRMWSFDGLDAFGIGVTCGDCQQRTRQKEEAQLVDLAMGVGARAATGRAAELLADFNHALEANDGRRLDVDPLGMLTIELPPGADVARFASAVSILRGQWIVEAGTEPGAPARVWWGESHRTMWHNCAAADAADAAEAAAEVDPAGPSPWDRDRLRSHLECYRGTVHGDDPAGAIDVEFANVRHAAGFASALRGGTWVADLRPGNAITSLGDRVTVTVWRGEQHRAQWIEQHAATSPTLTIEQSSALSVAAHEGGVELSATVAGALAGTSWLAEDGRTLTVAGWLAAGYDAAQVGMAGRGRWAVARQGRTVTTASSWQPGPPAHAPYGSSEEAQAVYANLVRNMSDA